MQGLQGQQEVERQFRQRGPDSHAPYEGRAPAAVDLQPGKRDVAAERIRDEIDGVAKVGQRANRWNSLNVCPGLQRTVRGRSSGCAWVGPACGSRPRGHEADRYILGVRAEYRQRMRPKLPRYERLSGLQSPDRMVVSFTYGGSQCRN